MKRAAEILEKARQLPPREFDWLLHNLLGEEDGAREQQVFTDWQKRLGSPEPGYDDWFSAGVKKALSETTAGVPHNDVARDVAALLRAVRQSKG